MSDAKGLPHTGYVSAKQVKDYFSISNSTLYDWLKGSNPGFPKSLKLGPRAVRFRAEDIRRFEVAREREGQLALGLDDTADGEG